MNLKDLFSLPKEIKPNQHQQQTLELINKMMSIINDLTTGASRLAEAVQSQQDSFNLYIATNKEALEAINQRIKKLESTTRI